MLENQKIVTDRFKTKRKQFVAKLNNLINSQAKYQKCKEQLEFNVESAENSDDNNQDDATRIHA